MPEKKESAPVPEIRHESGFVHYGFNENGVFHPISSERQGDYNDRIEAAREGDE
jgi:hypothetical protein